MNRIIFLLILISLVSPVKSQRIQKSTNGLYGLAVSKTDGNVKWLVKPKFSKMEKNYDDSFSVCDEYGKWGVISSVGKSVVKCKYSSKGSAFEEYQNTFASNPANSFSNDKVNDAYTASNNINNDINEEIAFKQMLSLAKLGDSEAMYHVAMSYMHGIGVLKNDELAFEWMSKSAENGYPEAQANLSVMYAIGIGVEQNEKMAFKYAHQAASVSNSMGIYVLGSCYHEGIGVTKDEKRAFEYIKEAANRDCVKAYGPLSEMYLDGIGTDINKEEGFKWAKFAAQEGDGLCQGFLSQLYSDGIGTEKNLYEAERWAKKSIEQNCAIGYLAYSKIFKDGIKKDTNKALRYINKGIELLYEERANLGYNDLVILDYYDIKGRIYLADNQLDNARKMAKEILKYKPDYVNRDDNILMDFYYGRDRKSDLLVNEQVIEIHSDVDSNIPINKKQNMNTFAIIIGNEHYDDVVNVEFANRDAVSFSNYCEKVLGIPTNNIRKYIDATYGKMVGALEDIREIAKAYNGDLNIIFYYAGHGIPNERDFSSYLLPVDGNGKSTNLCLSLNSLYDTLAQTEANRIMVFLDACFSGSVRGNGMLASARGVAIKAQPEEPRENMVIFAASSDDETAYPYKEQGHGLFTYYLLKKLQSSKGNLTLSELSSYINENVRKQSVVINKKSQTPTTMGSLDMNTNWFTK